LIYNKALIQTPPKTWEEVFQYAKNPTIHNPSQGKYALLWEAAGSYYSYTFFGSAGGYVFGNNGTNPKDIGINNTGAVKGLTTFAAARDQLSGGLNSGDLNGSFIRDLFVNGNVAMTINGPWMIEDYLDQGINIGVAKLPAFGANAASSFGGVRAFYVTNSSKYPNAASLFARFVTDKQAQVAQFVERKQTPAHIDAIQDPIVQQSSFAPGFFAQFQNSVPMPSIPEMGQYWGPARNALQQIWDYKVSPQQAANEAATLMADAIATMSD
jgi:arabinogalactan oligomer/maltooligosaccharide transport system substrate-binding protein